MAQTCGQTMKQNSKLNETETNQPFVHSQESPVCWLPCPWQMAKLSRAISREKRELIKGKQAQHANVDAENTNLRRKISKRKQCGQHQWQRESEFMVDCTRDIEEL